MAEDKFFIKDEDSAYGEGILVDEYNNNWSLVSARKGKDGTVYMQWAYPQKRDGSKGPIDKSVPWKIKIGDSKAAAASRLRELALMIEGEGGEPAPF